MFIQKDTRVSSKTAGAVWSKVRIKSCSQTATEIIVVIFQKCSKISKRLEDLYSINYQFILCQKPSDVECKTNFHKKKILAS